MMRVFQNGSGERGDFSCSRSGRGGGSDCTCRICASGSSRSDNGGRGGSSTRCGVCWSSAGTTRLGRSHLAARWSTWTIQMGLFLQRSRTARAHRRGRSLRSRTVGRRRSSVWLLLAGRPRRHCRQSRSPIGLVAPLRQCRRGGRPHRRIGPVASFCLAVQRALPRQQPRAGAALPRQRSPVPRARSCACVGACCGGVCARKSPHRAASGDSQCHGASDTSALSGWQNFAIGGLRLRRAASQKACQRSCARMGCAGSLTCMRS